MMPVTTGSGRMVEDCLTAKGLTEDDLFTMIEDKDASHKEIARKLGCSRTTLRNWLFACPVRSARERDARRAAAESCMRTELSVIRKLPDDGTHAQIAKMREEAAHWRRRSAIRDPAYSDKPSVQVTVNTGGDKPLDQMSDAELLAMAVRLGVKGSVIDGFAELVEPDGGTDGQADNGADGASETA